MLLCEITSVMGVHLSFVIVIFSLALTEVVSLYALLMFYAFFFQTKKAMEVGRPGRIAVEDIIFLIRKDPKKYSRVKELLLMSEELRKARKAFDEIKYATTN